MPPRTSREIHHLTSYFSAKILGAPGIVQGAFVALGTFAAAVASPAMAATVTITNTAAARTEICNIFTWMFWILISVSIIMIMWAAYLFVTGKDDAEQITQAKKTIFYAMFGVLAGLIAKGFPVLVASIFGQSVSGC